MKPTLQHRHDQLKAIKDQVLNLHQSPLFQHRLQNNFFPVIGEGNHQAKVMFVAEAPGINEAKTGHHFVGQSGKIFDQLMASINLNRSDVYITNIIKDKLPQNRNPNQQEINLYAPFLIQQIKIIQPRVIVTLGSFSTNYLLKFCHQKIAPLSQIHGQVFPVACSYGTSHILPMYHPSASLYNPQLISQMKQDMNLILQFNR